MMSAVFRRHVDNTRGEHYQQTAIEIEHPGIACASKTRKEKTRCKTATSQDFQHFPVENNWAVAEVVPHRLHQAPGQAPESSAPGSRRWWLGKKFDTAKMLVARSLGLFSATTTEISWHLPTI